MNNQAYDDTATRNPRKAYTDYENSTYTVVSKVAYLIGVQKRIFENEYEPPKMEWYEKLHADKNARIVRNLCMIRTALELNRCGTHRKVESIHGQGIVLYHNGILFYRLGHHAPLQKLETPHEQH